ncbi:MAG: hypothetical protein WAM44_14790 [Chthoniobacterales bacterium]
MKKRKSSRKRHAQAGRSIGPDQPREAAIEAIARHLHELKPEEAAVITLLRQELARRSGNGQGSKT